MKANPQILVFAGPNGSGKSTVTSGMQIVGTYINADDIKAHSGCSDLAAASEAERLREYCLAKGLDFTFETVLSTDRNLDLLRRARQTNYTIKCVFVLTDSAEINIYRIKGRVLKGGHAVPDDKVRSRYVKALSNLPELIRLCDFCTILDNSDLPTVIYRKDDSGEVIVASPLWSEYRIRDLLKRT